MASKTNNSNITLKGSIGFFTLFTIIYSLINPTESKAKSKFIPDTQIIGFESSLQYFDKNKPQIRRVKGIENYIGDSTNSNEIVVADLTINGLIKPNEIKEVALYNDNQLVEKIQVSDVNPYLIPLQIGGVVSPRASLKVTKKDGKVLSLTDVLRKYTLTLDDRNYVPKGKKREIENFYKKLVIDSSEDQGNEEIQIIPSQFEYDPETVEITSQLDAKESNLKQGDTFSYNPIRKNNTHGELICGLFSGDSRLPEGITMDEKGGIYWKIGYDVKPGVYNITHFAVTQNNKITLQNNMLTISANKPKE